MKMKRDLGAEIAGLQRMSVKRLREKYVDIFGEATLAANKAWLVKRIAWRMQAQAEGDLSERARQRAAELANDADLRLNPPKILPLRPAQERPVRMEERPAPVLTDERLPPPGTVLTRAYKGESVQVKILTTGFEFGGEVFPSLSAVAKRITGSHCNGFAFFHLTE